MVSIVFGKRMVLSLIIGLMPSLGWGQGISDTDSKVPVPYTLEDRERMIKLEVQVAALQNEVRNLRSDMNSLRSDVGTLRGDMMSLFMWGFGLIFSSIIGLIGFIIWDRRSSNQKIMAEVQANKEQIASIERRLVFKP